MKQTLAHVHVKVRGYGYVSVDKQNMCVGQVQNTCVTIVQETINQSGIISGHGCSRYGERGKEVNSSGVHRC